MDNKPKLVTVKSATIGETVNQQTPPSLSIDYNTRLEHNRGETTTRSTTKVNSSGYNPNKLIIK